MPNLFQGRIVWAPFADKNGYNNKRRPVVILTLTAEIPNHEEVVGVIASSTAAQYEQRPHYWIELPYHPSRRASTKFDRPSVAMCEWSVTVAKADIKPENIGGYVCNEILDLVLDAYLDYHKHNAPITVDRPSRGED